MTRRGRDCIRATASIQVVMEALIEKNSVPLGRILIYNYHMNEEHDDITLDTETEIDDSVVAEENQLDVIKKLRERLKKAEAEKQEYLNGWQREKADFINMRKRDEEAKLEFVKFSKEEVVRDIIPVLDSFDLAFQNKTVWESLPDNWRKGIESIYNQLVSILGNHGVTKMIPIGEEFDPKLHEAVEMVNVSEHNQDGKILTVLQPGYTLGGKEVRPPKVTVGQME